MEIIITAIVTFVLGVVGAFFFKRMQDQASKTSALAEVDRIIQKAKAEASKIDKDSKAKAKDFESRARRNVEQEIQKTKSQLKSKEGQLEKKLKEIEDLQKERLQEVDKQTQTFKNREKEIEQAELRLKDAEKKLDQEILEIQRRLSQVANMSLDEAKRELLMAVEDEAKKAAAKKVAEIELQAEKEADRRAKKVLAVALSRFASEYTSERTVSVLALPSEEVKGKIIGREGRNIRTLEALCGVDLIVDDTPEAVVISGFDSVRRELAKRVLEKLLEDGRVHPARIEEVVEKMRTELNKSMKDEGEKVVIDLGLGQMNQELVRLVGSMKYRHALTQNLLNHSLEVAHLSGLMAAEMGANVKLATRAGLLHDIGKAVEHTVEGNHAVVGAEVARKLGESETVCHAIRAHHNDEQPNSIIAHIVQTANILSNSRPGARRPGMENFINRLADLESIGNSFEGVLKTFAVQAGREIRVIVEASRITDDLSVMLSRDIARKIEREMPHVGAVRVVVSRESRSVEVAR